jgi:hypothetical protein
MFQHADTLPGPGRGVRRAGRVARPPGANRSFWVGTVSLVVEVALMVLCAGMLLAHRRAGRA